MSTFERTPLSFLAERHLAHGVQSATILAAKGDVALSGAELAEKLSLPVFVDGDLTVDGAISIDDDQALIVTGRLQCNALWVGEGRLLAKRLGVVTVLTFAIAGEDMHAFEVDEIDAGVWCTSYLKPPGGIRRFDRAFTIDTSGLEQEKLLSWIVDAAPGVVLSALRNGAVINDAWCLANKELVRDPTLRRHLRLA